jgi:hypothetical protein
MTDFFILAGWIVTFIVMLDTVYEIGLEEYKE